MAILNIKDILHCFPCRMLHYAPLLVINKGLRYPFHSDFCMCLFLMRFGCATKTNTGIEKTGRKDKIYISCLNLHRGVLQSIKKEESSPQWY